MNTNPITINQKHELSRVLPPYKSVPVPMGMPNPGLSRHSMHLDWNDHILFDEIDRALGFNTSIPYCGHGSRRASFTGF